MFTLSKTLVLAMFALSASALTTPARHGVAHYGRHHAIARNAAPADETSAPVVAVPQALKKRGSRRCKPRSSTSSIAISSTVLVAEPTTSSKTTTPTSTKAPEPTTTQAPTTTKAATTAQATTSAASSGDQPSYMVGTQEGDGTYYDTGLGACGITNNNSQYIAAVSHLLFDTFPGYNGANPNNNPMCGKTVTARRGSKSVVVALTDRCTGCALTDLDFSPAAFDKLGAESEGRIPITWDWN